MDDAGAAAALGPGFGRLTIPAVDAEVLLLPAFGGVVDDAGAAVALGPGFGRLTIPAVDAEVLLNL